MFQQLLTLTDRLIGRRLPMRIHLAVQARLSRLRADVAGRHAEAILVRSFNGRILVPAEDLVVGRSLAFDGEYDRAELEILLDLVKPEWDILVVGAHVGSILIPLAQRVGRIAGVEANPRTFDLLQANLLLNGVTHAEVRHTAAGDRDGEVAFIANRHNSGGSKVRWADLDRRIFCYDQPAEINVPMRRLDDVFPGRRFDLILIDIEGSESFALRGMPGLLSTCSRLYIEVSRFGIVDSAQSTPAAFAALLEPHFDTARVMGESGVTHPRNAFTGLLERLCAERRTYNVLFSKESTPPS